ncbi:MAG TPA: hypothetical protein VKX17_09910 [Planctomycetota bacterium]|nr:hypothetical protein [Planctomycetota bacterium]
MAERKSAVSRYLSSIDATGAVSETALYKPFVQYILNEILGYPDNCLALTERKAGEIPDIKLYPAPRTRKIEGDVWAIAEGKVSDDAIRDAAARARVWADQVVRYIRPETYYVILFAPRTICVCDVAEHVLLELHLNGASARYSMRGGEWQETDANDASLRSILKDISFASSQEGPQYEKFRIGEIAAGHIPLTLETLPMLEEVFHFGVLELRAIGEQLFDRARALFHEALPRIKDLEHRVEIEIDDRRHALLVSRLYKLKRKNRKLLRLFQEDYPEFCHDQAYAGTEEKDFREIFVTNSVHVQMSRLFFVRLCEDTGLVSHRISNSGIGLWGKFVADIDPMFQDLLQIAFKYVASVYERLFEESLFDWFNDLNGELSGILEKLLFRLNAFSFARVDRDLLGRMYQTFRPRAERKRLGEYYTPAEAVSLESMAKELFPDAIDSVKER